MHTFIKDQPFSEGPLVKVLLVMISFSVSSVPHFKRNAASLVMLLCSCCQTKELLVDDLKMRSVSQGFDVKNKR